MREDADKSKPLKLLVQDEEDLKVMAACLQDATFKADDMAYQPRQRRFAAVANRYRWELQEPRLFRPSRRERVRSGLHFDGVLKARFTGFRPGDASQVLELLTISCDPGDDGAATLTLVFAGNAAVRLEVECIDAHLADLSTPWPARRRPDHDLSE
jgi:hypothetical protein